MAVIIADSMIVTLLTILIGVLILVFPGLLRALIGGYLILIGFLTLL